MQRNNTENTPSDGQYSSRYNDGLESAEKRKRMVFILEHSGSTWVYRSRVSSLESFSPPDNILRHDRPDLDHPISNKERLAPIPRFHLKINDNVFFLKSVTCS